MRIVICRDPIESLLSFFQRTEYAIIWHKITGIWFSENKQQIEHMTRTGFELAFSRKKGFTLQVNMSKTFVVIPDALDSVDSFV